MSKLAMFGRPYVVFDPNNKEHRRWFAEFNRTKSWGKCPVRFVVENEGNANLAGMMQRLLIDYYASKEFPGEKNAVA